MLSKKEQLRASDIPREVQMSLVEFFWILYKFDICSSTSSALGSGQVIHFCKRNYKLK